MMTSKGIRMTLVMATVASALASSPRVTCAQATLTDVSTVAAGGNSLVSVSPSHFQGFSTNTGTVDTKFNAPVLDYGFYNRNSAFGSSLPGGASRVSPLTNRGGGNDYTDYWISSDPLSQPPDQANSGSRTQTAPNLTSGSINISGLTAGSLYIFHGRWQNGATDYLNLAMSGAGQPDVTLTNAGATVNGGPLMWATQIGFANPSDLYDTITFTHYVNGGAGGGYMSGTVLTYLEQDDATPPTPSQMTWANPPTAMTDVEISMTAVTATDDSGVEYQFTRYTNGVVAAVSAWQNNTNYTDTGLTPSTTYGYTVQARDRSANQNTNAPSSPIAEATTFIMDTNAPPTPTFVMPLGPVSFTTIELAASAETDPEGRDVEYRFNNVTAGTDSDWLTRPAYTFTGLDPATTYSFTVQARDTAATTNVSAPSAAETATTMSDINPPLVDTTPVAMNAAAYVSVTPGDQGFSADAGTTWTSFEGVVIDYAFFSGTSPYASGDSGLGGNSRVGNLSATAGNDSKTTLWESSDTSSAPDYSGQGCRSANSDSSRTSCTIDISGLAQGSIYVFSGSWQANSDWLRLELSGPGLTTLAFDNYSMCPAAGGQLMYAKRVDFSDCGPRDSITFYTYENNNGSAYFSGVVLTAPESAAADGTVILVR